jgi:hypothetical protein
MTRNTGIWSLKQYLGANNKESGKQNTDTHAVVFHPTNDGCEQTTANHGHLAPAAKSGRPANETCFGPWDAGPVRCGM